MSGQIGEVPFAEQQQPDLKYTHRRGEKILVEVQSVWAGHSSGSLAWYRAWNVRRTQVGLCSHGGPQSNDLETVQPQPYHVISSNITPAQILQTRLRFRDTYLSGKGSL
jgi:hypothetical protein